MGQSITLEDYNVKGILRALGKAWPFPHIAVAIAIGQMAEPAPARMDAAHPIVISRESEDLASFAKDTGFPLARE
jgi:hypothetical protein